MIEGFYKIDQDTAFSIDLTNFPTDIVGEVPYIVQTTNKSGWGSHILSCSIADGKFNCQGYSEAVLKDASSSFVKVFIVK